MKASIFIVFLVYIGNCSILAQTGNNWCLGKYGGVNFNTSPPTSFLSKICDTNKSQPKGYICMNPTTASDCAGNLWFYSAGVTVWNRYHNVMPNGMLNVNKSGGYTLSVLIPKPLDDSAFYLFIMPLNRYYYTLIDMRLDSGRGDVAFDPIPIDDSLYGPYSTMTGIYIKHANDTDYWVVIKPTDYIFKSYLVTKDSINRKPVVSNGFIKGLSDATPLRATRDGKEIIAPNTLVNSSIGLLQKWKFDNKTGKISKPVDLVKRNWLKNRFDWVGYPELSANDSLVYYGTKDLTTGNAANKDKVFICQLQRFAANPDKTIKYIDTLDVSSVGLSGIKLGPDNKLYYAQDTIKLHVINYPDLIGQSCKIKHYSLDIYPGQLGWNMPCMDFPIKRINNRFDVVGANGCGYDTVRFTADADSGFKNYHWYFGDGDSAVGKSVVHQYKNPGSYYVRLGCELGNCNYIQWVGDSITIKFKPNISLADSSYYTCGQYHVQTKVLYKYCDTVKLHLGNYDTVLYTNNSSTVNTFIYNNTFDTNGTYIYCAAAKNKDCYDSVGLQHKVNIDAKSLAYFTPNYTQSCGNSTITLTDSSGGMDSIIQQRKWTIYYPNNIVKQYDTVSTNNLKIIVQDTGYYTAKLIYITKQGCMDSLTKTNVFRILPQPVVYLDSPSHNPLCFGDSFILTAKQKDINYPPLVTYKWNAGQVATPSIKVDTANSYYVAAVNTFGCGAQSNTVKIGFLPQLFANIKTASNRLYTVTTRPVVSYTWYKDNVLYDSTSSIYYPPTGRYTVHVVDGNGCVANSNSLLHIGMNHIEHIVNLIRVWPNPTSDVLYIDGLPNTKTNIVLYDLLGKQVYNNSTSGEVLYNISIGCLSKGLYILSVGEERVKLAVE